MGPMALIVFKGVELAIRRALDKHPALFLMSPWPLSAFLATLDSQEQVLGTAKLLNSQILGTSKWSFLPLSFLATLRSWLIEPS